MAKINQVDLLRRLIREEVAKAILQEMPTILKESQSSSAPKEVIKEAEFQSLSLNDHKKMFLNFQENHSVL